MTARESAPRVFAAVPVFRVASVAASQRWYGEVLGFASDAVGPPDDPVFAILRAGDAELMLQRAQPGVGGARSATEAGGGWDVYLRVSDVRALRARVAAKARGAGPLVERPYGCLEFEVADPDGHVVVLGECR